MFQRTITEDEVRQFVDAGETIASYPDDKPFPSRLMLGWKGSRPIHVVVADNLADQETIIITVYQPDLLEWKPGFKKRLHP